MPIFFDFHPYGWRTPRLQKILTALETAGVAGERYRWVAAFQVQSGAGANASDWFFCAGSGLVTACIAAHWLLTLWGFPYERVVL